jgi:hypothetical protein
MGTSDYETDIGIADSSDVGEYRRKIGLKYPEIITKYRFRGSSVIYKISKKKDVFFSNLKNNFEKSFHQIANS